MTNNTFSPTRHVRTRFAPSPTGQLHIGGVRTVLFSYCLAQHQAREQEGRAGAGEFVLRIEDTDRERIVWDSVLGILEDFAWLGIKCDEAPSRLELEKAGYLKPGEKAVGVQETPGPYAPYLQSLRLERYRAIAEELIRSGHAYRCNCTAEELKSEREEQTKRGEPPGYSGKCRKRDIAASVPHVVRFAMPEGRSISLLDAVKGPITWESLSLRDPVLLKSDGFPTYHLAVVVDDHDMQITHVLRGDEWLSTTPLHLLLYQALNWETPVFAHLPPVLGKDGKKLSKRHGAAFVSNFREEGYLPEALCNFLILYGWAPPGDRESDIISLDEVIKQFSLERVESSGGIFSYEKLDWMNGEYIRRLSPEELTLRLAPFVAKAQLDIPANQLRAIVPHIQQRMQKLTEAIPFIEFLASGPLHREVERFPESAEKTREILNAAVTSLGALSDFAQPQLIEGALKEIIKSLGLPAKSVFLTVRIAATGKTITPPLNESLSVLGKERVLERLQEAKQLLSQSL